MKNNKITIHTKTNISNIIKREIRKSVGAHFNCPILIIDGNKAPKLKGNSFHYETKGGKIINSPVAYAKVGWSNMKYIPSSIRVEVGSYYLLNKISLFNLKCHKLRAFI